MGFFSRKRKEKSELDKSFDKVINEINNIDEKDNPRKIEHYILDSCEHIISTAKEVDSAKNRYRVALDHLSDINTIENLSENEKTSLRDLYNNILKLTKRKQNFKEADKRLPDDVYMLMQEREDIVVEDIHRMENNEKYKEKVLSDIRFLEGQKSVFAIDKEETRSLINKLRILIVSVFFIVIGVLCAMLVIPKDLMENLRFPFIVSLFVLVLLTFLTFLFVGKKQKEYRQIIKDLNQTISFLNIERMRYVNVEKALKYELDMYEVVSSAELSYIWEQYMLMVREQQAYRKNNVDLAFYIDKMFNLFKSFNLKYERKWIENVDLMLEEDKLTEYKAKFVERKDLIKDQIDTNSSLIQTERDEIDRLIREHSFYVPEVMEIISSVDKFCNDTLLEIKS